MMSGVFDLCQECAKKLCLSAMDVITDPTSSSRAYQDFRLLSFEVERDRLPFIFSIPFYSSKSLRGSMGMEATQVTRGALKNSDYMLLLTIHERCTYSLPAHWLDYTGASREAIARLHPDATL